MHVRSRICLLYLLIPTVVGPTALGACGDPPTPPPPPGKVTVRLVPRALAAPDPALTLATMRLRKISVFGNVQPHGPSPDAPDVALDALGAPVAVTLPSQPPGLYSRVTFPVENIQLQGTFRGTPLRAMLAPFRGPLVDLRAPPGEEQELGPGEDVTFVVTVDLNTWFAGGVLDRAVVTNGQILLDGMNNSDLAMQLTGQIARSFALQ